MNAPSQVSWAIGRSRPKFLFEPNVATGACGAHSAHRVFPDETVAICPGRSLLPTDVLYWDQCGIPRKRKSTPNWDFAAR